MLLLAFDNARVEAATVVAFLEGRIPLRTAACIRLTAPSRGAMGEGDRRERRGPVTASIVEFTSDGFETLLTLLRDQSAPKTARL